MELTRIPTTGEQFRFLETSEDLARIDWWLPPGGRSPFHRHPHQVERVTGVAGELVVTYREGRREFKIGAGKSLSVPAGVVHDFRNDGEGDAHMIVDFIPALSTKEFFEALAGLALDGKTDAAGRPRNPLLLASFVTGFRDEFEVASPPPLLQRAGLAPLAALARGRGVAAHRPEYSTPASTDDAVPELVARAEPLGR